MNMSENRACYVIAEIGVNHNGDIGLAKQLIDIAVEAQADAVKFQTFFADELVTRSAEKAAYQVTNTENNDSQHAMLKALELPEQALQEIRSYCEVKGIEFLSTPFSERAADLLQNVGVRAFKISSGDLTHLPMLRHIARMNKPIILSSGMANLSEIEEALAAIYAENNHQVSILHCVSNYPANAEDCNLAAIGTIAQAFQIPVGWSDHTLGEAISIAAVARGAKIIEKHITADRNLPGPDHKASMEPAEFREFVSNIRAVEQAIGDGRKQPRDSERDTARVARRSIVTASDLKAGDPIKLTDLKIVRPGYGLAPKYLDFVVGSILAVDVAADTPLEMIHFHA